MRLLSASPMLMSGGPGPPERTFFVKAPMTSPKSLSSVYGASVAATLCAFLLTLALWPLFRPNVSPFFFVAVMVGAW